MAETKKTKKSIYFLKATFNKKPHDLQKPLFKARILKPNVGDTEIKLGAGDILRIQRSAPKVRPSFIHITRYLPGDQAPTLQPGARKPEDTEGVQSAPLGKEFKDGECFLLINGCNVLYLGNGISVSKASSYLRLFFNECNLTRNDRLFDLSPMANIDKLELMQKQGVKSIKLSSSAFDIALPKPKRKNWVERTLGEAGDQLKALIQKDDDISGQRAAEDLIVTLEVRLDGNTRANDDAKDFMEILAETVVDGEHGEMEGFSIITRDGVPINPLEVRLHKSCDFVMTNRSISSIAAQEMMSVYLDELDELNLLE